MCHQQQQPHQTLHSRQALYYMHGEKGCGSDTLLSTGVHDPMCAYIHTTKAPLLAPLSNKLHRTCYEPRNIHMDSVYNRVMCFRSLSLPGGMGGEKGEREGGRKGILSCSLVYRNSFCQELQSSVQSSWRIRYSPALSILCLQLLANGSLFVYICLKIHSLTEENMWSIHIYLFLII